MEIDRRVPSFRDWISEADVASAVGIELSSLAHAARRLADKQDVVHSRTLIIRGKRRTVHTPHDEGVRQAHLALTGSMELPIATVLRRDTVAHGYIAGRSAYSNAKSHAGAFWVQQFDIKDFFPSISRRQLVLALIGAGMGESAAEFVASLTTHRGSLPLGFVPSPLLSNLVMTDVDIGLDAMARRHGLTVTRYADDITLSGPAEFDRAVDIDAIVQTSGFSLNSAKSKSGEAGGGVRVTGYLVSTGNPRLPQHVKRQTRQDLYSIQHIGVEGQARMRGRAPQSLVRRLLARLGALKQCEPLVYERWKRDYPRAFEVLDSTRASAVAARAARLASQERQLLSSPSPPAAYYIASHPAGG